MEQKKKETENIILLILKTFGMYRWYNLWRFSVLYSKFDFYRFIFNRGFLFLARF